LSKFNENDVEQASIGYFKNLGYAHAFGPEIAPDGPRPERSEWNEVALLGRLKDAIDRLNPEVPSESRDDALRKVLRAESPTVIENNRRFHHLLVDGATVEYRDPQGNIRANQVRLIDFGHPERNDWLVVNQYTVIQGRHTRRPDLVVFVNGLPVAVFELKDPTDPSATLNKAFRQITTYKSEIASLFHYNELIVLSDGLQARMGTTTSDVGRFMSWRTTTGERVESLESPQLETLVRGVFEKRRLLDILQNFIVFEDDGRFLSKKVAAYHQFRAVNKAVECTLNAASPRGDRRVGVVWHTQGSGKSLTMAFYSGKIARHPTMENPTIVVLTDRNDLDDQLFQNFSMAKEFLRQEPKIAKSRVDLRNKLKVASGGIVFSTVQKFMPPEGEPRPALSDRSNIVVIADEAHRSQYDFIQGYAKHLREALPKASYIGFTGTPLETTDRNTRAVFGEYIDIYDMQRSVEDGATVRIYYEGRLAKLKLRPSEVPKIDPKFDEVTEAQDVEVREHLKSKWASLEAAVGTRKRVTLVAKDLVDHFEKRIEALEGKAMVVVMSRRICVDLYEAIKDLRPNWCDPDDAKGKLKVVMTGSAADPLSWLEHIRNKPKRMALADRFRDPADPFQIVIVRDMWLTGFDAPSLHTMYVDKPMRGHGLMQTIARVNRVFKDKPGGLIVDYLGLADELRKALRAYTEDDRKDAGIPQSVAVKLLKEKCEIIAHIFHGFDRKPFFTGTPGQRVAILTPAMEHVLKQEDGMNRYLKAVKEVSAAFALAVPADEALELREDVQFYQAVRGALAKTTMEDGDAKDDLDNAVRQIVSQAVTPGKIVDIFSAAGLKRPELSILDDQFLEDVKKIPYRNLALEVLRKLLNDEIKARARRNIVQGRLFSEMLEETIRRYQNRSIETAQVITELIQIAKEIKRAKERGENIGLNEYEEAFYDALETNDSAVKVLGDENLKTISRELVETVRRNVSIDWTSKESVRARLRVMVKRVLKKHGYPPDKQEKATQTVLQQAELLCAEWT
jgi:type I restriction enzyme R subunit